MPMGFQHVRLEHRLGVSRITLARPEAANTINLAMAREMHSAVREVASRRTTVLVLAAEGSVFCGGGDVHEMSSADDTAAYLGRLASSFHDALKAMSALDAVIVAVVDGPAAGGGLGLALAADVILAGDGARFITAYDSIGLTPDCGVSYLLPRTIGIHRAQAMTALGIALDGDEAVTWGLAARRVPSDEMEAAVDQVARRFDGSQPAHIARTRRLYRDQALYERHLDLEAATIAEMSQTPQAAAAITTFATRRNAPNPDDASATGSR